MKEAVTFANGFCYLESEEVRIQIVSMKPSHSV